MVVRGGPTNSLEVKWKAKEKGKDTHIWMQCQRITRKDKKAFLSEQCKEIEENKKWERLKISSGKLKISREHFMQHGAPKRTEMVRMKQKQNEFRRGGKNTPSSVQFSHSVVSHSLQPHESQYASPPCPFPAPRVYSNSCPSSRWCHPAISSSVVPFSSCPQSLPASESFPMSQLVAWLYKKIKKMS